MDCAVGAGNSADAYSVCGNFIICVHWAGDQLLTLRVKRRGALPDTWIALLAPRPVRADGASIQTEAPANSAPISAVSCLPHPMIVADGRLYSYNSSAVSKKLCREGHRAA